MIKKLFKKKNKEVKEELLFKLPILNIEDNFIIGEDNTYKLVCRVSPINAELASIDSIEETAHSIQGALSAFEGRKGIYILSERIDIRDNISNIELRKNEVNDEFKVEMLDMQKRYLESMASKTRNVLNFYIVLEHYDKDSDCARQVLLDGASAVKSELETSEMYVEQLTTDEIKELLYTKMNLEQSVVEPYRSDFEIEDIYPGSAVRCKDGSHLEIDNSIYKFYAITKYPQTVDKYRWLKKLLTIQGNVNIAIILNPKNKSTVTQELSKAVDEANGRAYFTKDAVEKQKYLAQEESAKEMIKKLGNDNVSLYDTSIIISVGAENMKELNALSNIVRSKISSSYLQSTEIKRKDFAPFYAVLPILADNKVTKNYVWNLSSDDIASIVPFDSSEFMEKKGTFIGENEISKGLVIADYRNKIYNNSHMCILADSGSGKTFFIKTDAIRNIPYVDYTIMFDIKGDLQFPFGKRYVFSATSDIVINPFHIRNAIIDTEQNSDLGKSDVGIYLSQKIMDLIVFFKWIIKDMTAQQESILDELITKTYAKCGLDFNSKSLPKEFCTMQDLYNVLEEEIENAETEKEQELLKDIKICIRSYAVGTYSKIFNGQTNWDFNEFTVFDISNVPESVVKPLYDILLKDTWQFAKKDGTVDPTKKNIYVDECHEFADPKNPQTLAFLSTKLSKQGRGFGIRLITATQNLPDFLAIPRYGQAIIDNSFFKLFMRLGESDLPVAKKLYSFSDGEMKIIKGTGAKGKGTKGKGIFIVGSQRVAIQTRASKYELEIIDPIQFEEIYKVKSRYLND